MWVPRERDSSCTSRRVRDANAAVTRRGKPQAQVDVVARDDERLVEAPDRLELRRSTIMQAAVTASQLRVPPSARPNGVSASGQARERMAGVAVQTERRTACWTVPSGYSNIGATAPISGRSASSSSVSIQSRIDDLGVVVEKHERVGRRACGREVVERGEVERASVAQHAHTRLAREAGHQLQRFPARLSRCRRARRASLVLGPRKQRHDAPREQLRPVAEADDRLDARLAFGEWSADAPDRADRLDARARLPVREQRLHRGGVELLGSSGTSAPRWQSSSGACA